MLLSDFISLIGIIIAVIAFINENERIFIINKFSLSDKVILVLVFLFLNYLIFFEWFLFNFPLLKNFTFNNFPKSNTWAYIITILSMLWIFFKIFKKPFPKGNTEKILKYYEKLLNKGNYNQYYNLFEKYNYKDILQKKKLNEYESEILVLPFRNKFFLRETSNYNYKLLCNVLINKNIEQKYIYNFLLEQVSNNHSYFNSNALNDKEINQFISLLLKIDDSANIFHKILLFGFLPIDKIINITKEYCKECKDENCKIVFENIFDDILNKESTINLKTFKNSIKDFNFTQEMYRYIVNNITIRINNFFDVTNQISRNLNFTEELVQNYLHIIHEFYNSNEKWVNENIPSMLVNKEFKHKLYSIYKDNTVNYQEDFTNLINAIADE